jgi:hypothetical protein
MCEYAWAALKVVCPACTALHSACRNVELAHDSIVRASEDADNGN